MKLFFALYIQKQMRDGGGRITYWGLGGWVECTIIVLMYRDTNYNKLVISQEYTNVKVFFLKTWKINK